MPNPDTDRLKNIKTLRQLLTYLRDELDWPIQSEEPEEIVFDYTPEDLGLNAKAAVKIKEIKQLRPLAGSQPWGIFFVNFENKQLPVSVMRLILRALVFQKRASPNRADRQAWQPNDLLFVSSCGTDNDRSISFAHFVENKKKDLSELRVLGWDDDDTPLHMDYVSRILHEKLGWDAKLASNPEEWRTRWSEAFLLRHRHTITKADELAEALAELAKKLRNRLRTILKSEDGHGEIRRLQRAFEVGLIHDLNDESFSDMFAQTVTYGLFSVAVRRTFPGEGTAVTKDDPANLIFTSPFLKEMFGVFLGLKSRKGKIDFDQLGISDVTDLLNSPDTHMEVVLADFNNKTRGEDPVIHFYEHFLSAYNKQLKVQRGVFYTPQPVVSCIVRSVHELLQTEFGLADGLADTTTWGEMLKKHPSLKLPPLTDESGDKRTISTDEPFVQILDPATGTATFLVEVIDVIHKTLTEKWGKAGLSKNKQNEAWNDYVPKHLLPRLHGFELMMAPYAIAHMKIGLKLAETSYRFGTEERARIYLTNALEPKVKQLPTIGYAPLANEAKEVNEIKWYKRFTVVIGNPPYSHWSGNLEASHRALVEPYRFVRGERIRERGALQFELNIQDDYVKFIRLAEIVISLSGAGTTGLITNNGYLDSATFRGLRVHLLDTYEHIRVLDLHGSVKAIREAGDENVFDIQQGVAICVSSRLSQNLPGTIRYEEFVGSRNKKYQALLRQNSLWSKPSFVPRPPGYLFISRDESLAEEYESGIALDSMFVLSSSGVKTNRDGLAIALTQKELDERMQVFLNPKNTDEFIAEALEIEDKKYWNIREARKDLNANTWIQFCKDIEYRPFDNRKIIYHDAVVFSPRKPVMVNLERPDNLALLLCRQQIVPGFNHVFVTRRMYDCCLVSNRSRENTSGFPLYTMDSDSSASSLFRNENGMKSNITLEATSAFKRKVTDVKEDAIFNYCYAILHSPGYRHRYAKFLQREFPRVLLPEVPDLFKDLSILGAALVELHLLETPGLNNLKCNFYGSKSVQVEAPFWSDECIWVDKAQTCGFRGVKKEVWNFSIGSYRVCEKWLKDRRDRDLTKNEFTHYQKILVAISETIRLMKEIDEVIEKHGGWPGAFDLSVKATQEASIEKEERSTSGPAPLKESFSFEVEPTVPVVPADDQQAEQNTKPKKARVSSAQDEDKRARIDETEQNDVLCTIRQIFSEGLELSRELAFKKIAKELGYDRVGSKIEEILDSDIRTAVKRGILENERGTLKILCKTIEGYERDFLKDQFLASIGRAWVEREEAVRAFTRFMGFRRAGEKIQDTVRSLINGLLREDRLESDGHLIRRKS